MILIGIAGGSGSGKTTFTEKVIAKAQDDVSTLHMDSYYLKDTSKIIKTPSGDLNFDHPKAFDWTLLRTHLKELQVGNSIECPDYNFKENKRSKKTSLIEPSNVILFEGIFSLFDAEIRELLDIKIFLNVEADIRFIRRLHRDTNERGRSLDSVITQYYSTVRPMYEKFLNPQKQFADVIVGEETDIAASILTAKIDQILSSDSVDPSELGLVREESSIEHNQFTHH